MVSPQDSHLSLSDPNSATPTVLQTQPYYYYTPPPSSAKIRMGLSKRTIRSTFCQLEESSCSFYDSATIDLRLGELANKISPHNACGSKILSSEDADRFLHLDLSRSFGSACSSDISGELRRLAAVSDQDLYPSSNGNPGPEPEPCPGFLQRETFSTEIIESISPEDLQPAVKMCIDGLNSSSVAVKRSAAAKLRLLAKNRADNRALIGEAGAIPALFPLLHCSDPLTQEHAVTALLNLSLHEGIKTLMANAAAIKSLVYVLKTGTETSKQNAACALLNIALIDENIKLSIGACGAIPPLVVLLISGSNRGKKDALTTLYKLCSTRLNKERALSAGVVMPLIGLVGEEGTGLAEKAMVVLNSLAGIELGRQTIVEGGGLAALVEVIEDGSDKGKEFAVLTLLQLCGDSVRNRGLLVREGGIPPLVALSQAGTAKAKHKAERLLEYLREPRHGGSTSAN